MNNLLRYNHKQRCLVYDFETCNVNLAFGNYPWQISYLIAQGDDILETKDFYIKWTDLDKKISKGAAQVTRFNYLQYQEKAIQNIEVLDDLRNIYMMIR